MLNVREIKLEDIEEASSLSDRTMVDSWEKYEKGYYPRRALEHDISSYSSEYYKSQLEDPSSFGFVAEENDRLVGIASGRILGTPGLARLGWIGVHPEHQRRGVGKSIMKKVIDHCRAKDCHKITLYTLPVLIPAINLYLRSGFVPEAYLREEWWGVDFIKMSLWLRESKERKNY
ncbi:MAG: GNAT family N-acetyltransferase [Candidatus Hodarchaeota archaeon]